MRLSKRETYLWLNSQGFSAARTLALEEFLYDIEEVWELSESEILSFDWLTKGEREKILKNRNDDYIEKLKDYIYGNDFNFITYGEEDYPEKLKKIYDAPRIIYYKGEKPRNTPALAVVGSRAMTDYGKWASEKIVRPLAEKGITIVSGLAMGIDKVAHEEALKGKGYTIGVLGNGIDIVYPKTNEKTYKAMEKYGTIISEFFPGTPSLPHNFPLRNRIIWGLSEGVLVIEAKERSGSLITANQALEQGRDVFAIPGSIASVFSGGTNKLIQIGAKLVMKPEDIIEEVDKFIKIVEETEKEILEGIDLSDTEKKIMELVLEGPVTIDDIHLKTGFDIVKINQTMTILELKGLIKEQSGRTFIVS